MEELVANFTLEEEPINVQFELEQADNVDAVFQINAYGEDKHYTHEQGIASDTWVIEHNLGKKPAIEVTDSANTIITGFKAQYNDLNTVTIYFNGAFTGYAYLN